jgi:hypothetical protein
VERRFEWVTELNFWETQPIGWTSLSVEGAVIRVNDDMLFDLKDLKSITIRQTGDPEANSELRRLWCKVTLAGAARSLSFEGSLYLPQEHPPGPENQFPQALASLLEICAAVQPELKMHHLSHGRVGAILFGVGAVFVGGVFALNVMQDGNALAVLVDRGFLAMSVGAIMFVMGFWFLWFAMRARGKIRTLQEAARLLRDDAAGHLDLDRFPHRLKATVS